MKYNSRQEPIKFPVCKSILIIDNGLGLPGKKCPKCNGETSGYLKEDDKLEWCDCPKGLGHFHKHPKNTGEIEQ